MIRPLALLTLFSMAGGAVRAQGAWEWRAHGLTTFVTESAADQSSDRMFGGGLGLRFRTTGRLRAQVSMSVGDLEGRLAARPETFVTVLLNPYKTRGLTPFVGGGLALLATRRATAEYLLVMIGLESSPAGRRGWFVEGGLGGGIRLAVGIRGRWGRGAG